MRVPSDAVTIAAIAGIVAVEIAALSMGFDGAILAAVIGSLAALGGYKYGRRRGGG